MRDGYYSRKYGKSGVYVATFGISSSVNTSVSTSVLTDESVEDEFSHLIRLKTGFIPKRGIRFRQTNYQSQTNNSSLI